MFCSCSLADSFDILLLCCMPLTVATKANPRTRPIKITAIILLTLLFGVFLKRWFYYKEPQLKDQHILINPSLPRKNNFSVKIEVIKIDPIIISEKLHPFCCLYSKRFNTFRCKIFNLYIQTKRGCFGDLYHKAHDVFHFLYLRRSLNCSLSITT